MLEPMETPLQVSIIDDSLADAQYLKRLLNSASGWNIEASIFDSPDEAYEKLKDNPPDILIVDYLLGRGRANGVEVMQRFKSGGVHPALVLLTGYGGEEVAADALRAGAMDYLVKDTLTPDSIARSFRYVCERKKSDEALQELALCDPLTGLANRNEFRRRLEDAIKIADREGTSAALMLLDLDNFKETNDSFGHPVGDELLKLVGCLLKEATRETDTVARFGGDEFAVIMPYLPNPERVGRVAERIIKKLSEPITINGCLLTAGTSIGVSIYPRDAGEIDELLFKSDKALYEAKARGRGVFQFFDESMNEKARAERIFESDLKLALVRDEFLLHYQPQFDISENRIIGAEALVRWQHPTNGLVMPEKFIDGAETLGFIGEIGKKVIRAACLQGQEWQASGVPPFRMAVNISPRQFNDENFVPMVEETLDDTGFDPSWLELEITENLMMKNVDQTVEKLQHLRNIGVSIAIDDFGKGYSSFSYLKHLPVQRLKIDQAFVRDLIVDPSGAIITEAVINLGHGLNLKVVAEGIETEEQLACLRQQGCEEGQGFYLGRPLPPGDFAEQVLAKF